MRASGAAAAALLSLVVLGGIVSVTSLGRAMDVKPSGEEGRFRGAWIESVVVTAKYRFHETSDGKEIRWEFKGDKIDVICGRGGRRGKFTLYSSKLPKEIDLVFDESDPPLPPPPPGEKAVPWVEKGIYEFDGDVLRVCLSRRERPKRFAADGEDIYIYELKRER